MYGNANTIKTEPLLLEDKEGAPFKSHRITKKTCVNNLCEILLESYLN